MEDSLTPDATLSMLVGYYEAAEQATVDSRAQAELHRDYRNGDQWTAEEIAALNKRKQPIVTIDRIGPKVDFLLGMVPLLLSLGIELFAKLHNVDAMLAQRRAHRRRWIGLAGRDLQLNLR